MPPLSDGGGWTAGVTVENARRGITVRGRRALLRNRWNDRTATGDAARAYRRRLDAIVDPADLDRRRAQQWSLVRSIDDALWVHEQRARDFTTICWSIAAAST